MSCHATSQISVDQFLVSQLSYFYSSQTATVEPTVVYGTNKDSKINKIPTNNGMGRNIQCRSLIFFFSRDELAFCHNVKMFLSKTCQNSTLVTVINNHVFPVFSMVFCMLWQFWSKLTTPLKKQSAVLASAPAGNLAVSFSLGKWDTKCMHCVPWWLRVKSCWDIHVPYLNWSFGRSDSDAILLGCNADNFLERRKEMYRFLLLQKLSCFSLTENLKLVLKKTINRGFREQVSKIPVSSTFYRIRKICCKPHRHLQGIF